MVVRPEVLKLGGTAVIQCQVLPPPKTGRCIFNMHLLSPSVLRFFPRSICHSFGDEEPRYVERCDVTAGRYGIRITNVEMADAGRWGCHFRYYMSYHNSVHVDVVAPPSGPVLTSEPTTAIGNIVTLQENSSLTITCNGSQYEATGLMYKWNGVNLSGESNNTLNFTRISKTDSGVYTCNVSNIVDTVTGSVTVNVLYAPVLSERVEPVVAQIGETAEFTVKFDVNPPIGTTLCCVKNATTNESVITSNELKTIPVSKTQWDVVVQSVQASDFGTYLCELKNAIGSVEVTLHLTKSGDANCGLLTCVALGAIVASLVVTIIILVVFVILFVKRRKNNSKSSAATKKKRRNKAAKIAKKEADTDDVYEVYTHRPTRQRAVNTSENIYGNREMVNVARNASAFRDLGEEYEEI
ncbi:protein turtle homolog B-like isoform X2 [Tubulanus polymorphus]